MNNAIFIPRPGVRCGPYPQRVNEREPVPFFALEWLRARLLSARAPSIRVQNRFLDMVYANRKRIVGCDQEFIDAGLRRLRTKLASQGMVMPLIAEVFAIIDACMQKHLQRRLYDTQLLAGWLMLDRRLIEMHTGEGKTLAVALAAATCALAGMPVHVVTSNDYLVVRDAELMAPLMEALGLTVGAITSGSSSSERTQAYRCNITYCTAKELAFDYLRDHLAGIAPQHGIGPDQNEKKLRGLCMVIIDEADSILIDEARMPLILSDTTVNPAQTAYYRQALFFASQLTLDKDYELDHAKRLAHLTAEGQVRVKSLSEGFGGDWRASRRTEETLCLALAAQQLFIKDVHYLVIDKSVVIIDDTTGRQAQGRVWSGGLHQLIEAKEGCPISASSKTVAQITFQRFFSRYLRISGISGTLTEAKDVMLAIYGLPVVRVPLRLASRRKQMADHVFVDKASQWHYVVAQVRKLHAIGRPVLIGTNSVNDSEMLSEQLTHACINHEVLNARFDAEEACIVAQAGQRWAVTVSTNMAGRGTDISLADNAAVLGGLHVISCQLNDSRRIDRQLYGRCARQGDPGTVEQIYCLESKDLASTFILKLAYFFQTLSKDPGALPTWFSYFFRQKQTLRQRARRREQWFFYLNDRLMDRQLAFVSKNE